MWGLPVTIDLNYMHKEKNIVMSLSISVITPSYNQGAFIEKTIQSVLSQQIEVEYMIFDADSKDNTLGILKKYETYLKWVSEPDDGQSDAVNKGIRSTKGDIIAWINSDDIYLDGALQRVRDFFQRHPSVGVVYGDAWYIDENDNTLEPYHTEEWNLEHLKETCFICQPAAFFRRTAVEQAGLLDATLQYCMDYEFWLRLGLRGIQFVHLPKYLAASRLYPDNKTMKQKTFVLAENNRMLKAKLGYVPDTWLYSQAFREVETKGYNASRSPRRFYYEAAYRSLRAAWLWNKRISIKMLAQIGVWAKKSLV